MCDVSTLEAMRKAGGDFLDDAKDNDSNFGKMWGEGMGGSNWQNRLGGQWDESWGGSNWQNRLGGQYEESWGGGNWMDRVGLGQFKDGAGGDGGNSGKTDEINALKQVTTGAGYGGGKAAKFITNKKNAIGKKSLVIKKPSSYKRG